MNRFYKSGADVFVWNGYIAYRDESESKYLVNSMSNTVGSSLSNEGFRTIYKRKEGGRRFTELLDKVSLINPEVSIPT